jgi:hypothetical protein
MPNPSRNRKFARPSFVAAIAMLAGIFALPNLLSQPVHAQTGAFTMQVDALNNCMSVQGNPDYIPVSHPIDNGYWEVTAEVDVSYHPGCCRVSKVGVYATSDEQPHGWFHVVTDQAPIYLNVTGHGTEANDVYAYFIDLQCWDNSGTATLHFRKVPASPVCSGKDCN